MMKRNLSTITNNIDHQLLSTTPPLPPSSPPPTQSKPNGPSVASTTSYMSKPAVHRTITGASNLANLLPTGTLLAFQTFIPSFSNRGTCISSNTYLTVTLIASCTIICFLSSFTDSFNYNGKLYHGIATFKGLYVLNNDDDDESTSDEEILENIRAKKDLSKYKISFIDFVHAFASSLVFLVFAFSDINVQNCFFPNGGPNLDVLVINLPIAAGLFSSLLFMLFPTTRRGFGYADMPTKSKC